jgi:hypothetical protein
MRQVSTDQLILPVAISKAQLPTLVRWAAEATRLSRRASSESSRCVFSSATAIAASICSRSASAGVRARGVWANRHREPTAIPGRSIRGAPA